VSSVCVKGKSEGLHSPPSVVMCKELPAYWRSVLEDDIRNGYRNALETVVL
jgi:hypothetical protein